MRFLWRCTFFIPLVLLSITSGGCSESDWVIPLQRADAPSKLWTDDPRTHDWNGVVVEYGLRWVLIGEGGVDALVRSRDGRHRFHAHGSVWYENAKGERVDSDISDDLIMVLEFDGRQERYFPGDKTSMRGRALILTKAGATTRPRINRVEYIEPDP